tara:strand:- start:135 stop:281 length:147 start_codon:yes stop_codon:yes gene_type:complete
MDRKEQEALQRLHEDYRRRVREKSVRDKTLSKTDDEIKHIHTNHDEGC